MRGGGSIHHSCDVSHPLIHPAADYRRGHRPRWPDTARQQSDRNSTKARVSLSLSEQPQVQDCVEGRRGGTREGKVDGQGCPKVESVVNSRSHVMSSNTLRGRGARIPRGSEWCNAWHDRTDLAQCRTVPRYLATCRDRFLVLQGHPLREVEVDDLQSQSCKQRPLQNT
jgi:hypothetical protein